MGDGAGGGKGGWGRVRERGVRESEEEWGPDRRIEGEREAYRCSVRESWGHRGEAAGLAGSGFRGLVVHLTRSCGPLKVVVIFTAGGRGLFYCFAGMWALHSGARSGGGVLAMRCMLW